MNYSYSINDTEPGVGWAEKLFEYNKQLLKENRITIEDARAVDWRFLVGVTANKKVCIIGGSHAIVPLTIASECAELTYINNDGELLEYIQHRAKECGITNLSTLHAEDEKTPLSYQKKFDICCVYSWYAGSGKNCRFGEMVSRVRAMVNSGGCACFFIENSRLLLPAIRKKTLKSGSLRASYGRSRSLMKKCGFAWVESFSPLPSGKSVPLYYLPLDSKRAIQYFVRCILPMIFLLTPEARKKSGMIFPLVATGTRIMQFLRLEWLLKYLVPEYFIVAGSAEC